MDMTAIKLECLRLATANGSLDGAADVEKAEAYFRFVSGEQTTRSEPPLKPQRKSWECTLDLPL